MRTNTPAQRKAATGYKYLACIHCGGDLPIDRKNVEYCSKECHLQAIGSPMAPIKRRIRIYKTGENS